MSKNRKYYPDYFALYPGVEISAEILSALRKSDRKMKYMEYELKAEQPVKDEDGSIIALLPGREDSLERLIEMGKQFMGTALSPEDIVLEREEVEELHHVLASLSEDERALIDALFVDRLSERKYAARLTLSKTAIHARKIKLLEKIREILGKCLFF